MIVAKLQFTFHAPS